MSKVDMALNFDKGYWDISFENGDYVTTSRLDTSLLVSLFTDGRASESQQPVLRLRRGWWGNLFTAIPYGSLLWLPSYSPLTDTSASEYTSFTYDALNWTISENFFTQIAVTTNVDVETGNININVQLAENNVVTNKTYEILRNT